MRPAELARKRPRPRRRRAARSGSSIATQRTPAYYDLAAGCTAAIRVLIDRHMLRIRTVSIVLIVAWLLTPRVDVAARGIPGKLDDAAFWRLVETSSEPSGTFPSDNFVSNELMFQTVIPRLTSSVKPGGVYIGVGP